MENGVPITADRIRYENIYDFDYNGPFLDFEWVIATG
jgi:hypothetical protein